MHKRKMGTIPIFTALSGSQACRTDAAWKGERERGTFRKVPLSLDFLDSPLGGGRKLRFRRYGMEDAVRIEGLRKAYGSLAAVDGVDLAVARGEIFGLLGPNGAGKSTTIECALGTRKRDAGRVSLLGLDPEADRKELFERVGVQFQESGYQDKIRVGELCELTSSLYRGPADWGVLLERFGLGGKRGAAVSGLSGGLRQRLAIVLALIPGPELVFLDELTTGLDPKARREVWELIRDLRAGGATVFLSSHYMDEVEQLCDRIAILRAGKVVAQGRPAELVARSGTRNLEEAFLMYMDKELETEEAV
jgi:ABC-2 type transport system ATP-binding protein